MLLFKNNGILDLVSINTFGVSAKSSDKAIGFFGTGLKYAISILLRYGHEITVFSGDNKFEFFTEDKTIRDKNFKLVMVRINDNEVQQMPFTTELGKTWHLWQAYRELYYNCIDEDGEIKLVEEIDEYEVVEISLSSGIASNSNTCIYTTGLDEIHENNNEFILHTKPKWDLSSVEVHERTDSASGAIFYRGVKVYQPNKFCVYNYNIKEKIVLTEDRTMANAWYAEYYISRSLAYSEAPAEAIIQILTASKETFENTLSFSDLANDPTETFLAVVGTLKKTEVNESAYRYYGGYALEHLDTLQRTPVPSVHKEKLKKAIKLIEPLGFQDTYAITITDLIGDENIRVTKTSIYLNEKIFLLKEKDLAVEILIAYLKLTEGEGNELHWLANKLISVHSTLQTWSSIPYEPTTKEYQSQIDGEWWDESAEVTEKQINAFREKSPSVITDLVPNFFYYVGEWTGYRPNQGRIVYCQKFPEEMREKCEHLTTIKYSDGTCLLLRILEAKDAFGANEILGYSELVQGALDSGKDYYEV